MRFINYRIQIYLIVLGCFLVKFDPTECSAAITSNGSYVTSDPVTYSSVTWADVNGDGYADLVGANDDMTDSNGNSIRGRVYCYDVKNQALLWSFTPVLDAPYNCNSIVMTTPTVADLDGEPGVEILFCVGYTQANNPGALFILDHEGQEVFYWDDFYDMAGAAVPDGVHSTAAVGDINCNGVQDFVFGGFDQRVYAFTYSPKFYTYLKMWEFMAGDTIWSSPALANIDSDPYLEIMIGIPLHTEVDMNNTDFPFDIEYDGGMMLVLDHDGSMHPNFRAMAGNAHKPKTYTTLPVRSSPAVADIDNDGYFEIVHATSAYRNATGYHGRCGPDATTPQPQPYVYAWNHTGNRVWNPWPSLGTAPASICDDTIINDSESSPAIADINMDGTLDVIVGQRSSYNDGGVGNAKVWVLKGTDGSSVSPYPLLLTDKDGTCPDLGIRSNPAVVNIDGDAQPEILIGVLNCLMILDSGGYTTGNHSCFNQSGGTASCIYTDTGGQITYQTAGVWNADTDSHLEIGLFNPYNDGSFKGKINTWDSGVNGPSTMPPGPWPMFRQNCRHTGLYDPVSPGQIVDLEAEAISDTTVRLSWTSTGHNGNKGCAHKYLLRYTVDTAFVWETATPISINVLPQVSGTAQTVDVDVLGSGSSYYFGLVALDEVPNMSAVSNIASLNVQVPALSLIGIAVLLSGLSLVVVMKLRRRKVFVRQT
ncbi:FG-GAP repeat protein [bacterium]|nr:FG-GAP repeat protein [bacterium]